MQFFKNMKFRKKMMCISILPILIISICIGGMSYFRAKEAAEASCKNSMSDAVNRIDLTLTNRVRQMDNMVEMLLKADDTGISIDEFNDRVMDTFGEVDSISILQEGEILYSTQSAELADEDRAAQLLATAKTYPGKIIWSDAEESVFEGHTQKVIHVYGRTHGEKILLLEVEPAGLGAAVLTKQKVMTGQTSALLDHSLEVISTTGPVDQELRDLVSEQYHAGKRTFSITDDVRHYYATAQYNGLTGWVTVSFIDEESLFPGGAALQEFILVLSILCIIAAAIFLRIFSRYVTKPLTALNEGMKEVQMSHLDVRLPNDRKDEIGELTDSFNYMTEQIHQLVDQVYKGQLAQQAAEIEALQAQINPHFLYNTLDSINWMLIDRDEMDISRIVVAFGKLMQYSMRNTNALVPLTEEYQNIRDYLLIQKNRLEEQLEYELELDPALEEFYVPKLILQPLVENSIKYALKWPDQVLKIRVCTEAIGQDICIEVSNDGVGMDEAQLQHYRELLAVQAEDPGSIGIRNIAKRLQLLFRNQCRFEVTSTPETGTQTRLYLPRREGAGHENRNH